MNERIKQLAARAGVTEVQGLLCAFAYQGPIKADFLEEFAELIVKECVGVVEGGSFLHDQAPTAQFARECSGAIKRHFGVEE